VGRLAQTRLINGASSILNAHDYLYDLAGRRTNTVRVNGDYVNLAYDSIGQLTSAAGYDAGGGFVRHSENFSYTYDAAGNLSVLGSGIGKTFNVDNLNQITNVTRDTELSVAGFTTVAATNVTVTGRFFSESMVLNDDSTFAGDNFDLVDGTNTFTAVAQDGYGRTDTNVVTAYLPVSVSFRYDSNGNMRTNGTRVFEYNDENQLISTWVSGVSSNYFVYDGKMRRRIERNYQWTAGTWVLGSERRFIYDGNLVLQERDGLNLPTVTLTRGSDLSGSLAGAGGIGGLLALTDHSVLNLGSVSNAHFFYHCDGNGNVTSLADAGQNVAARYLYDPFGNTLLIAGPKATINRYRFSSKPVHEASGMYDYLYRWYVPELQRWLNRDPIGEHSTRRFKALRNTRPIARGARRILGSDNLYQFARNSSVRWVDRSGLDIWIGNRGLHDGISVGNPDGLFGSYSFQGDIVGFPFTQGYVYFDEPPRDINFAFYLETTPDQDMEALGILAEMLGERWRYCINSTCQDFSLDMFDFFEDLFPDAKRRSPPPPAKPDCWGRAGFWGGGKL